MTTTRAYYTTATENPEEPIYHEVALTTESPLSSYGQPVVLESGEATPAQSFARPLFLFHGDASEEARDLVAKANKLSGFGDSTTVAENRAAFDWLFAD